MNKKIKVIELLQILSNRKELPKKIKWDNEIYILNQYDYKNEERDIYLFSEEIRDITTVLNDEVEILEDNTEEIEELKYDVVDENGRGWYKLDTIADKVTELVKAVNKIRKDLNK